MYTSEPPIRLEAKWRGPIMTNLHRGGARVMPGYARHTHVFFQTKNSVYVHIRVPHKKRRNSDLFLASHVLSFKAMPHDYFSTRSLGPLWILLGCLLTNEAGKHWCIGLSPARLKNTQTKLQRVQHVLYSDLCSTDMIVGARKILCFPQLWLKIGMIHKLLIDPL